MLFPHHLVQIRPRGIHTFAPHILPAVEHIIKDLDTEMGHADLVYVRKAHRETDIHLAFVFHHRVDLAADITGRLLDI